MKNSFVDCLEILDEILSERLGFHIVEAITNRNERVLAKPALFQKINEKLKDYKQGYLAPKRITTTGDRKKRQNKIIVKPQFHPMVNFSLGIKMGIANTSISDRYIADEVSYWVDDMLDAVVAGKNKVENKAKKKVEN